MISLPSIRFNLSTNYTFPLVYYYFFYHIFSFLSLLSSHSFLFITMPIVPNTSQTQNRLSSLKCLLKITLQPQMCCDRVHHWMCCQTLSPQEYILANLELLNSFPKSLVAFNAKWLVFFIVVREGLLGVFTKYHQIIRRAIVFGTPFEYDKYQFMTLASLKSLSFLIK